MTFYARHKALKKSANSVAKLAASERTFSAIPGGYGWSMALAVG